MHFLYLGIINRVFVATQINFIVCYKKIHGKRTMDINLIINRSRNKTMCRLMCVCVTWPVEGEDVALALGGAFWRVRLRAAAGTPPTLPLWRHLIVGGRVQV